MDQPRRGSVGRPEGPGGSDVRDRPPGGHRRHHQAEQPERGGAELRLHLVPGHRAVVWPEAVRAVHVRPEQGQGDPDQRRVRLYGHTVHQGRQGPGRQYSTVSTNTRRTTTQELLQPKAKDAGFQFQIKNYDAGTLFGDIGPHGKFTIADYATGGSVDPSITSSFGCDAIPTKDNRTRAATGTTGATSRPTS